MISRKSLLPAAAALFLAPAIAMAELPSLMVTVKGALPATGTAEVSLFSSAEEFMVEPLLQKSGDVDENGEFLAEFIGIAEGDYAIVVVHDENDNGVLDTGFLGFGGEKIGYSNDSRPWLGRPSFEDAKISVTEANQQVEINLE